MAFSVPLASQVNGGSLPIVRVVRNRSIPSTGRYIGPRAGRATRSASVEVRSRSPIRIRRPLDCFVFTVAWYPAQRTGLRPW